MKPILILLICLAACSPVVYNVRGVKISAPGEVADCTPLGKVVGVPGVFGPLKDIGLNDARKRALERAQEMGGNAVVFDPIPVGVDVYELPGKVYRC